MDEKDWEIITVLHDMKNVTKAAKKLYITQPALSFRLKNIERFFDVTLVLRGRKGIQFTPEGEFIVTKAREHLKNITAMRDTLSNMRKTVSGIIRIGSTNYTTRYFLPAILKRFKAMYPSVEFRVSTGVSKDIYKLTGDGDVHLGLVRGVFPWNEEQIFLFKEKLCIVSNSEFSFPDLPLMSRIQYTIAPTNQEQIDAWWNERFSVPPSIAMSVDRADTCYELISQGFGYGILPTSILSGQPRLYVREMTYLNGEPVERPVWVIFSKTAMQLRLVREFVQMIRSLKYPHDYAAP